MSKESNKIKELCEFIWYLESKFQLFELNIDGVFIWEYIRMQVYYKLASESGILSSPGKKISISDRYEIFIKGLKYLFTDNIWTLKKHDTIIFSHPRSTFVDNEYIDIYTEYLIDEMKHSVKIVDFEADYFGEHIRKRNHTVHKLDWIKQLCYMKYFFVRKKKILSNKEIKLLELIEGEIKNKFDIDFKLKSLIESKVKLFRIYYNIYTRIFKKINPSSIYFVVAYYYAPIIKAAKDCNIRVKELQHGVITKYHLGYSFPVLNQSLHYFPDELLVWDSSWKSIINYPINNDNIIVDKFRHLEKKKNEFRDLKKEKDTYLVLSQTAISENIAKKILENLDFFINKKIIYKLHPAEFEIWKRNKYLVELQGVLSVEIISNEKPLYQLMATCEFQVGVFSTALYEGVSFNCKTILLDIQGIEYMEDFIKVNKPQILN